MKTRSECIPCFFKQALSAARLAGASLTLQKKILSELVQEILKFDLELCPSQMGRILYRLVRKRTGKDDPFKRLKQKSNKIALRLYPRLKERIAHSKNRLLAAAGLAIAGNVIDYGVGTSLDVAREIERILAEENRLIRKESKKIFNYSGFEKAVKKANRILYLGDNAGEAVFDRVLIEELKDKEITYVVRGGPIINDVLREDAVFCGIDKCARIISSGCDAPGVILEFCSKNFQKIYQQAELIISKGQGNFEALSGRGEPIFFLFKAKCPVVAEHLGCKLGDVILK